MGPTQEVTMSRATRGACGLILTSLVATATALAQGTRAQFGGIGVYSVQLALTSMGATAQGSETRFTWNVGGGFVYGNDSTALFVEARYLAIAPFGRLKATFLPFTAGIRTGGK